MNAGKIYEWLLKNCSPALILIYLSIGIILQIFEMPWMGKMSDNEIYGLIILNTLFVFAIDHYFYILATKTEEKKPEHFEDEGI